MRRSCGNLAAIALVVSLFAGTDRVSHAQVVQDRITQSIESGKLAAISGTVHPLAQAANDHGPVETTLALHGMSMDFERSAAQEAALQKLMKAQQDPASSSYRKWLTLDQFAAQFGMSDADIAKATAWLQAQGFTIDKVADSRNSIRFSGTAGQVEQAFHTQMHSYSMNGEMHFANATEISVPAAMAGVVGRVGGLTDFKPKPRLVRPMAARANSDHAQFTSGISGGHFVAPGDFAEIYNVGPLYTAGFTGSGQTIGIVGQTDIVMADITDFRSAAGLPANNPTVFLIPGSSDPGTQDASGDINEADLDLEWSGAVAKGASIVFINSTNAVDGSLLYAVQNKINGKTIPILSSSYGDCEPNYSTTEIHTLDAAFEQADTQGQTIIGPAGDTGAADCDYTPSTATSPTVSATHGLQVDYPASSVYVTGLGGSEFTGDGTDANPSTGADQYWSANGSTDVLTSALSYIPESAWNDTAYDIANGGGLSAGGGGASSLFTKPSWQTGVTGIPSNTARNVPDLALNASADHDPYLYCTQIVLDSSSNQNSYVSSCDSGFRISDSGQSDDKDLTAVGGTSAAAPSFAGILALIEQKLGTTLGNINPTLYTLAGNATTYAAAFHDITTGNNMVPCTTGSTDCPTTGELGYAAGTGYDQASGLGSVNAANLGDAFAGAATEAGSTTTVAVSPASPLVGATVTITATVATNSGTTTPTGTVTFTIDGVAGSAITLANGVAATTTSFSTGGSHTISAAYSGDTSHFSSTGTATLTVGTSSSEAATTTTLTANPTSVALGGALTLTATVQSATAGSVSGSVTFTVGSTTVGTASITAGASGTGTATLSVASASAVLGFTAGTDTITATYGGDTTYGSSSGTASIAVTNPGLTMTVANLTISSATAGSSGTAAITITSTGGYSGTVDLTASASTLDANYAISPMAVAVSSGGMATSTITIQTVAANLKQGLQNKSRNSIPGKIAASGAGLGALLLMGIPAFRRKRWPGLAGALVLLAGLGTFMGCGGGSSTTTTGGSPAGTYTVTVTATDSSNSAITTSANFTVTIQ